MPTLRVQFFDWMNNLATSYHTLFAKSEFSGIVEESYQMLKEMECEIMLVSFRVATFSEKKCFFLNAITYKRKMSISEEDFVGDLF